MVVMNIIFLSFFLTMGCSVAYNNTMTRSYIGYICQTTNTSECEGLLGPKSFCLADHCQCLPHYHINNQNVCIRDRGLKEFCQTNDECYWGPEMVDRIECSLGVCSCVHGYVPDQGKTCVKYFAAGATVIQILPSFIFSLITITLFVK